MKNDQLFSIGFIDSDSGEKVVAYEARSISEAVRHATSLNSDGSPHVVAFIASGDKIIADCIFLDAGGVLWSDESYENFKAIVSGGYPTEIPLPKQRCKLEQD